jgi:hypothetical protein
MESRAYFDIKYIPLRQIIKALIFSVKYLKFFPSSQNHIPKKQANSRFVRRNIISHKLGDKYVLVDTSPTESVTVTPIPQRRRQQPLSDRLAEINREFNEELLNS